MLCGCSTAVHWSARRPKSHCASISSRPLLARVAESTVIFGPMAQFGCLSASAGVTCASRSGGQSRNAPPLAVSTIRRTPACGMALEALEDRAVLAVHRQEFRAVLPGRGHDELAGEHENFLRGEGEVLARGEGGEGGLEAGGADDGDEHEVGLGQLGERDEPAQAAVQLGAGRKAAGGLGRGVGGVVEHRDVLHAEVAGDLGEPRVVGAGGDADELELVAVRGDDAQGVFADGAGGAEQDDAFAGAGRRFGHESRRLCGAARSRQARRGTIGHEEAQKSTKNPLNPVWSPELDRRNRRMVCFRRYFFVTSRASSWPTLRVYGRANRK